MRRLLPALFLPLLLGLALEGKVDVGFQNTPFAEAVRLLLRAADRSVLLIEPPAAQVTLDVKGLPVREALNSLLVAYAPGFAYEELPGGLVVVGPKERVSELRQREFRVYEKLPPGIRDAFPSARFVDLGEGRFGVLATPEEHREIGLLVEQSVPLVAVRSFPVRAEEAAAAVKEAFPGVTARYVGTSSVLVVRGDPRVLVEVREFLSQSGLLGEPSPARLEVFSLRYLEPDAALEALKGLLSEETLKKLKGDKNLRIIFGTVDSREAEQIRSGLALLDHPKKQVELLVRIEQVDEQQARALGIDWQALSGALSAAILNGSLSLGLDTGANEALKVIGALRAGESRGLTRTLVNTRLYTLDGKGVKLSSGGRLLLPQLSSGSGQGQTPQPGGYFTVDFGLTVDLTPVVMGDEIQLTANVGLGGTPTAGVGGGVSIPSQNLGTVLRVKPGTTAVMGGIISTANNESVQGVPVLSWIPVIGELFKTRQTSSSNSVILVFVSAQVVNP